MSKSRRNLPASYVIRLYREDPDRLDAVAGLIEDVQAGRTTSFRNGGELLRQLHAAPTPTETGPDDDA